MQRSADETQTSPVCPCLIPIVGCTSQEPDNDKWNDKVVVDWISTLMDIPTVMTVNGTGSKIDNVIGSIAKQNVASKQEPVNSFEWCMILKGLVGPHITFDTAVDMYNRHPDVVAWRASADANDADDDEAGLSVTPHKAKAIRNLFENLPQAVLDRVQKDLNDVPWKYSVMTEAALRAPWLWKGSTVSTPQSSNPVVGGGLVHEATMSLDASLPLTERGATMFWNRWMTDFKRSTTIVPLERKKNYRLTIERLQDLRNIMATWDHVEDFVKARMDPNDYAEFSDEIETTPRRYGTCRYTTPPRSAISFLHFYTVEILRLNMPILVVVYKMSAPRGGHFIHHHQDRHFQAQDLDGVKLKN